MKFVHGENSARLRLYQDGAERDDMLIMEMTLMMKQIMMLVMKPIIMMKVMMV